jgi:hypothetical protein
MESTSIKMVDRERTRDCEEKMANNKMALAKEVTSPPACPEVPAPKRGGLSPFMSRGSRP